MLVTSMMAIRTPWKYAYSIIRKLIFYHFFARKRFGFQSPDIIGLAEPKKRFFQTYILWSGFKGLVELHPRQARYGWPSFGRFPQVFLHRYSENLRSSQLPIPLPSISFKLQDLALSRRGDLTWRSSLTPWKPGQFTFHRDTTLQGISRVVNFIVTSKMIKIQCFPTQFLRPEPSR